MKLDVLYFEEAGPQNTAATLAAVAARCRALGIRQVVVASSYGETAVAAHELLAPLGVRVLAVTISHGWESLGWCMSAARKAELRAMGIEVITGIHALGDDVGSAFTEKNGGRTPDEIVRETLYRFSQGMKVAVEDVLMAADAGLLDMLAEVISVAGTGRGADTAIVCKPAYARSFMALEIREILAKPRVP